MRLSSAAALLVLLPLSLSAFPLPLYAECGNATLTIRGHSLSPLVENGEIVKVVPAYCATIRHGDLIVFTTSAHKQAMVIKLVAGIPGDKIAVKVDGTVTINGKPTPAPDGKPHRSDMMGITAIMASGILTTNSEKQKLECERSPVSPTREAPSSFLFLQGKVKRK